MKSYLALNKYKLIDQLWPANQLVQIIPVLKIQEGFSRVLGGSVVVPDQTNYCVFHIIF